MFLITSRTHDLFLWRHQLNRNFIRSAKLACTNFGTQTSSFLSNSAKLQNVSQPGAIRTTTPSHKEQHSLSLASCRYKWEIKSSRGQVHPRTGHEGPKREYKYSSTLSLTSALDGVGGQRHALATLPPGKTRYPLYRRLGGPQGRSGRVRKIQMRQTGWNSECIYHLSQISVDFSLLQSVHIGRVVHPAFYTIIKGKFNVLLTVHHAMILGNCRTWRTNSFQCIYLFIVLYMFRVCHAHHQEKQIVSIRLLVVVTSCWWPCRVLVGSKLVW